jgi:hypothetical protein
MASRRRWVAVPEPGRPRICEAVKRGYMHQHPAPQLPRKTTPNASTSCGVKGRNTSVGSCALAACLRVIGVALGCEYACGVRARPKAETDGALSHH